MDAYLFYRTCGAIAPRVPVKLGYTVTGWLAEIGLRRDLRAVHGLRSNLRHAMGQGVSPEEIEAAVRRAYRALLQNYFDLFRLPALTLVQLRQWVQIVGLENLEAARAVGRGIVLLTAHTGNPEAGLQVVGTTDLEVMGPAEHLAPERLYQYMTRLRTRHGLRLIPSDGPLLELFRVLRRNGAVGLALDRDTTGSGVPALLCGERARVPDGYAHIAAKTHAPLVPAFCRRLPDNRTQLNIGPMFRPDDVADRQEAYRAAFDFGVRELERFVTAHPDQWVLTTPLWSADG